MKTLDLTSLYAAMSQRRTFMTTDKDATISLKAGTCWMGSVLKGLANSTLTVVAADAGAADVFSSIELYGEKQKLLATATCKATSCSATFKVTSAQSPYFVARAKQKDGGLLVSAPIWLSP